MSKIREAEIKTWNPFSAEQWIAWLGATLIAGVSVMVFLYGHFLTKESFKEETHASREYYSRYFELVEKRLDRIENKIDHLK